MRFGTKISLIPLTALLVVGCIKDDEFSKIPSLEFKSFTTFSGNGTDIDSASFTFLFTDGDGDLGDDDTSVVNCFLDYYEKDGDTMKHFPQFQRTYRLPNLTPNAKDQSISGEVSIILKPAPIFNQLTDSLYEWSCKVNDRAGNLSNQVATNQLVK
jgi:hypothetical protein